MFRFAGHAYRTSSLSRSIINNSRRQYSSYGHSTEKIFMRATKRGLILTSIVGGIGWLWFEYIRQKKNEGNITYTLLR